MNSGTTNEEYWFCVIGPIKSDRLPLNGADGPMRMAVRNALENMNIAELDNEGRAKYECSSGWGITKDMAEAMFRARCDTPSSLERTINIRSNYGKSNIYI